MFLSRNALKLGGFRKATMMGPMFNNNALFQQRMFLNKLFSSGGSVSGYSDASNPKVYFEITQDNKNIGRLTFELYKNHVPKTAENFRSLCAGDNNQGYTYAGSGFHRIIQGFMAQGGDFTNHNGTGGRSIYGDRFPDEEPGLRLKHLQRGMLSMANAGPNTNGSQFFITFDETPWLNGAHVVFGELVDGEDILKTMEAAGTRGEGRPRSHFAIESCGEV